MSADLSPARTALVTGAARGIGRALAAGLVDAGLSVALLVRDRAAGERVAHGLRGRLVGDARCGVVVADVTDADQVLAAAAEAAGALGPVDLLVNNAGVIEPREVPAWEEDPATWRSVVETDLLGPFHCVRAVVPAMVAAGGGRVITLSSGAGADDRPVYSAYCAAKAGLFRLSGNLHLAGHDVGLRSFDLSPGVVQSEMTGSMASHEGRSEWTPVQACVELAVAIARGELDAYSGRDLRAGIDTVDLLRAAAPGLDPRSRRLRVVPLHAEDDV